MLVVRILLIFWLFFSRTQKPLKPTFLLQTYFRVKLPANRDYYPVYSIGHFFVFKHALVFCVRTYSHHVIIFFSSFLYWN